MNAKQPEPADFNPTKISCPYCSTHYLYRFRDGSLHCSGGCGAVIPASSHTQATANPKA